MSEASATDEPTRPAGDEDRDPEPTACTYTEYRDRESGEERELPATGDGAAGVEAEVWEALRAVEDPEMPVSVVDLGLIYDVTVDDGVAAVEMTLTYTGCPARDMLTGEVNRAVLDVDGIDEVDVTVVWSPGWTVDMVTEQGEKALREFGLSV